MKYYKITFFFFFICAVFIIGCSEVNDDITPQADLTVHPQDFGKPGSPNFHGFFIKDTLHWDMSYCRQCHGGNYGGGTVNVSCNDCHNQPAGPENCATCHGSRTSPAPPDDIAGNSATTIPGVGAHQVHLSGNNKGRTIPCAECHNVPGRLYEPGHVDTDEPAEVIMNKFLANINTNVPGTSEYDAQLGLTDPNPQYSFANNTCSNTYCHGTFKNGNTNNSPVWTAPATAACGTCHGDPGRATPAERALPKTILEGGSHPAVTTCSACHGGVVDDNLRFVTPAKHIDGKLNLFGNDIAF